MPNRFDIALGIGVGLVIGGGLTAVIFGPRIARLRFENTARAQQIDPLNIRAENQRGEILSLKGFIEEQTGEITALESDFNDLGNKYDQIIADLEDYRSRMPYLEAKQALTELIELAKLRKIKRALQSPTSLV
jgi:hypothetical protein